MAIFEELQVQQYRGQNKTIHERFQSKTGILLTNLGTPEAPTAQALRPYLRQFLSDPRVIELPKWKWWPILYGIILRVRPAKSAKLYASVWTEEGSPLLQISLAQVQKLQQKIDAMAPSQGLVKLAMRYGEPSIANALNAFQDEGINRIVVLPLYPQYAGATVGSTFDAVAAAIGSWRWLPELHFLNTYHDHEAYINALCSSIRHAFSAHGQPEKLVLSYHGMPQRYFDNGDPYYCFCQKTSRLVAAQLGLDKDQFITSFQSQFGREQWLKPDTSATLTDLAKAGVKKVAVICPGFSADCLETIEEIGEENRQLYLAAGGQDFHYIPALNDTPEHIDMMWHLLASYFKGSP